MGGCRQTTCMITSIMLIQASVHHVEGIWSRNVFAYPCHGGIGIHAYGFDVTMVPKSMTFEPKDMDLILALMKVYRIAIRNKVWELTGRLN